jgi:Trp operon repressor
MPGVRCLRVMQRRKIQFALALYQALRCSAPWGVGIQEIQRPRFSRGTVPEEAVSTLRAFISYISRREPDLFHDNLLKRGFLTEDVRKAVARRWTLYQEFIKKHERVRNKKASRGKP